MSGKAKSPFVAAMDEAMDDAKHLDEAARKGKALGENGAPEYTREGVGDPRVALFFKLVRDIPDANLDKHLAGVIQAFDETGDVQLLVDLVLLAFQTRATRGDGKGEKRLFRLMLLRLHRRFPVTVEALVELIPHFGYYKDWLLLTEELDAVAKAEGENATAARTLARRILELFAAKLQEDASALRTAKGTGSTPKLSLAAKWAPREGRHFSDQAKRLSEIMFPDAEARAARRLYRKRVAELNRALKTTEVLMAAHRYAEIEWGRVASLCMNRHRKAFLNEKVKGAVSGAFAETGNRFPDDADRVVARKRLRASLEDEKALKIKGKALQPHEIVAKVINTTSYGHGRGSELSTAEEDVLNAQWVSLREDVRAQLAKAKELADLECLGDVTPADAGAATGKGKGKGVAVDLGHIVPLVDVSGSMSGQPMAVAVALGILTAELTAPAFRHRFLTFESKPTWVRLDPDAGVVANARAAVQAPWGGSTDFVAACERILAAAQRKRLKPDEIPDLLVLSDMQFNMAGRGDQGSRWETHFERLQRRFAEVGEAVCGEPYPAPRIIFWNLRGATGGAPATSDTPNVQMLSGFSPALLKLVLAGADLVADEVEVVAADGTKKVVREGPTPYETLRKALDAEAFNPVRAAIARVGEGPFAGYSFDTPDGFEVVEAMTQ